MRRIVGLFFLFVSAFQLQAQLSEQQFKRPEATYAPGVVWQWMNGNISREGINLDLEAMAATGLSGGILRFTTDGVPTGNVQVNSLEWKELVDHAFQQADRLGLKFKQQDSTCMESTPTNVKPKSFNDSPYTLKAEVDSLFIKGNKRLILQTFVHQPHPTAQPGVVMSEFGSHLNRNNTWFNKATDFFQYISRCHYVLQSGLNVADVAYYIEEDPIGFQNPNPNYTYDILSEKVLIQESIVKNRRLFLSDGKNYWFLILPEIKSLSLPVLRKIKSLLEQGLWVSASKPTNWSGNLTANEQAEWKSIVSELWSKLPDGVYRFGSGRLYINVPSSQLFKDANLKPDFNYSVSNPTAAIQAIHFRIGEDHAWFVSNQRSQNETILASFRVTGMQPEWWNPQTGQIRNLDIFRQHDEHTLVPLDLAPSEAGFIVFRKPISLAVYDGLQKNGIKLISPNPDDYTLDSTAIAFDRPTGGLPETLISNGLRLFHYKGMYRLLVPGSDDSKTLYLKKDLPVYDLSTGWNIRFPEGEGAPASHQLDTLASLHTRMETGVKYFSGTASWQRSFTLSPVDLDGHQLILDLGHVAVVAEVYVNGHSAGICWKPPYRMEITHLLKPGMNQLDVRVTNLWTKRLIGDEYLPEENDYDVKGMIKAFPEWYQNKLPKKGDRLTFVTRKQYNPNSPLVESGLIGPVSLSVWKAMKVSD